MTPITISQLEDAINAARSAEPAAGAQAALSSDVARLADVYGELIFRGHKVFDADTIDPIDCDALMRWLPTQTDKDRAA